MKTVKTKKELDNALKNLEHGRSNIIIKVNPLGYPNILEETVTSTPQYTSKSMQNKVNIGKVIDYSNLSQWVQMEIWKYYERDWIDKDCTELADRIIKRILEDKNLVNNKIHKEGFDAGVLKERKRILKQIKDVFSDRDRVEHITGTKIFKEIKTVLDMQ